MRILDVYSRPAFPPYRGAAARSYNLLSRLGRNHEVRQFTSEGWKGLQGSSNLRQYSLGPSYEEFRHYHPIGALVTEISLRAWHSTPVWSGAGLRVSRPSFLRESLDWAEVVLIEHPWQFDYCYRQNPAAPVVYSSHNLEVSKLKSVAQSFGIRWPSTAWIQRVEKIERKAVQNANLILAVSPADRQGFLDYYGAPPGESSRCSEWR